jgi:3'-phosphoadenosine 5'-phosphosulfate sulfotransferase (PAPS reductase)/FAD synthetase
MDCPVKNFDEHILIASMSGGKDSTAMGLELRDRGIPFRPVFIDTGWESKRTYAYVREYLPTVFGDITEIRAVVDLSPALEPLALEFEERLGHYSAMIRTIIKKGMFPSRVRRFCTQELKVFTMRDYFLSDALDADVVNAVGIRAEESKSRSSLDEWEWMNTYDCYVWRPLIRWKEQQVIDQHTRHGVLPNPHYLTGSERVGCWPCIYARKSELRGLGGQDAERVQLLADLERVVGDLADARAVREGFESLEDRGHHRPTWFQGRNDDRKRYDCPDCDGKGGTFRPYTEAEWDALDEDAQREAADDGRGLQLSVCETCEGKARLRSKATTSMWPIHKVIEWANERKKNQFEMFAPHPHEHGCMRWGLCDTVGSTRETKTF